MPRPCTICIEPEKARIAAEMIIAGATDQAIADHLQAGRMSVRRHRIGHVIAPTQARLAIASKGAGARQERQQLAAAAAAGAPNPAELADAVLGLRAQVEKMSLIEGRLERVAAAAEEKGSAGGVAAIAAQQLRGVEVGAKLAGVGAYGAQQPGAAGATHFAVNIMFSNGERVAVTANPTAPTIDLADGG